MASSNLALQVDEDDIDDTDSSLGEVSRLKLFESQSGFRDRMI